MATIVETVNPQTAPPYYAGCKRPQALALAVYDPAAAAQQAKRMRMTQLNISANARALVPFVAPPPIDAVPLAAAAPNRTEPSWIRSRLWDLGFRMDMELIFIDEKAVTATDLDAQQNRFRLPTNGVQRHLRGMLSAADLQAADMLHEQAPRARTPKPPPVEGEQGGKRKKTKGKKHVGLPVVVVDFNGLKKELKLTQWASSRGTVIKGDGYLEFIRQCSFKEDEVVEIWAFKQKLFHFFGVDMCKESLLHIVIAKKDQQLVDRPM